MNSETKWQAKWIWGGKEESPRNEWRCFRKTFRLAYGRPEGATLSITADSRYILYVNGRRVGRGPVRSWPFELAYDTYDVGHMLRPGEDNVIAVMVLHFGVTNFYYLRGRGGLLAQLAFNGGDKAEIATDGMWKTSPHPGQDRRSPRMSCQHGFVERIDARVWTDDWSAPSFDDSSWERARVIGAPGMEPWTKLVPRGIPLLTEERIYPSRVVSLHRVKPIAWTTNIDIRNLMMPESVNHANHVGKVGYIATVLRLSKAAEVTFGFLNSRFNFGPCCIDGRSYDPESMTGELPQKFLTVRLEAGDRFFLMEITGTDHGDGFHMGIDCDTPFELISPWQSDHPPRSDTARTSSDAALTADEADDASPFVAVGPFAVVEHIDHRDFVNPLPRFAELSERHSRGLPPEGNLTDAEQAYLEAKSIGAAGDLNRFAAWVRPVPNSLMSRDNVFALSIWKKESEEQTVDYSLQNAVVANPEPAVLPLYERSDTELVIDFGKEYSGFIEFDVDAPEGTIIDFYGFEYMSRSWRQETYRLDNTMRYTCREGRQRYTSAVRRGFRYLMVTVRDASRPVKLFEVKLWQSNYPVADVGRFRCSDSQLNEIWQISRHTTKLCMEDTFVDCPAYEQVFWVGDARNEAIINYYIYGATGIAKRSLRLVPGSKFMTPYYVNQVPSGWNSVIPNWTFFWAIACAEYAEHTGDREFAREMWPHIRYTLDHYLNNVDERGLLLMKGWNFFDWAEIDQPNDGAVSHQNMFLAKALRVSAGLAEQVEDAEGAGRYRTAAEKLAAAVNEHLWSEARQAYIDCIHADGRRSDILSMQTQVVAMLCGIAEGERRRKIESYLVSPPADFVQIGTAFMSFFYYEALTELGLTDMMVEDMRRNYGIMLRYDSSTCYESYPKLKDGKIDSRQLTRSHCHAWSAAPGYFLGAEILGVRRAAPGWKKLTVSPKPAAGISWAEGAVPLPDGGCVEVAWQIDEADQTLDLWMKVPDGHEAKVLAPEGYSVRRVGS